MKILWIVNILLPELAERMNMPIAASGSWLIDISNGLSQKDDVEIAVAAVGGNEFRRIELNGKIYYMLPGSGRDMYLYSKRVEKMWKRVVEDFQPDLVHIHGTEYSHGLSFMRQFPSIPAIITTQGIMNRIKEIDFANVPMRHYIFGRTLRQWTRMNGEIENHFLYKQNAKCETEMFQRAVAVNSFTAWDTSIVQAIHPGIPTYQIEYNLREEYYSAEKWSIEKVSRHTIFTNPSGTPLKGLHMLIQAAALLKDKYPDILIKVPGLSGVDGNVRITSAYTRYLHRLIKRLGMENHIEFLGKQNTAQMIENAQKAHIVVVPSAIEGVSLVLREAMFVGAPCIASFRGGMACFVSHGIDGYLYDFPEYTSLAFYINELFSKDEKCLEFSKCAIAKAEGAHQRKNNVDAYVSMYQNILDAWAEHQKQ